MIRRLKAVHRDRPSAFLQSLAGRIDVHAARAHDEILLRVVDTGIGISSELLPQMFDMFVQGDHALDRSQGGLGIGLTLVRQLVSMHNGHVECYGGGRGEGSEFVVRLPAMPPPRAT